MGNIVKVSKLMQRKGSTMAAQGCPRCGSADSCKERVFSTTALAALVVWGELEKNLVGKPICEECYSDLREVLVVRSDEVPLASQEFPVKKAG